MEFIISPRGKNFESIRAIEMLRWKFYFDNQSSVCYDFIPEGETLNTYTDIIRRLRDSVRRNRPEKWMTNSKFVLHNYARAHRSVLV
jgi:hypothetical protein